MLDVGNRSMCGRYVSVKLDVIAAEADERLGGLRSYSWDGARMHDWSNECRHASRSVIESYVG